MAKWGNADFRQLVKMQKKMEKLNTIDLDLFCKECSKELAARLLSLVINDTPVGIYKSSTGKVGGTLKRGWTGDSENVNPRSYAKSLPISKNGSNYIIEIINPVEYASYVEFGHRTANHKGWVKGKFMLTKAEISIESRAEKIIEKKIILFLGAYFNGK